MTVTDLYSEFETELRAYAATLAHGRLAADDLVQETFIRALAYEGLLAGLKPYQQRAWLRRVLKNLFLDELRAARQQDLLLADVDELGVTSPDGVPLAAALAGDLFAQIPERYRELMYRHYVLGMTGEEIGEAMGISAGAVRARLHQALKWLRANQSRFV